MKQTELTIEIKMKAPRLSTSFNQKAPVYNEISCTVYKNKSLK